MRHDLTKSIIDGVEPARTIQLLWDDTVRGLHLEIRPTGRRMWRLYYRTRIGQQRRMVLGMYGAALTIKQARDLAREILGAVARGDDPAAERRATRASARDQRCTVDQYWLAYAEAAGARWRPRTRRDRETRWARHIAPRLGRLQLSEVTPRHVRALHEALAATPREANHCATLLRSMFQRALADEIIGANPAANIARYPERRRERFLSGDELLAIDTAARQLETEGSISSSAASLFRLLTATGARLSEIMHCRWEWVDRDDATICLPESKTGPKKIYLNALALEEIEQLARRSPPGRWLIPGHIAGRPMSNPYRPWRLVLCRADDLLAEAAARSGKTSVASIRTTRLHDLRHTWASVGVGQGISLMIVGKGLGHARSATTERYAHLGDSPIRHATTQIGEYLRAVLRERPADVVDPRKRSSG